MAILEFHGEREEADRAVSSGVFSNERAEFSRLFTIKEVADEEDLRETIVAIVGTTATAVTDGGLNRVLPPADPQFRWMVAGALSSLQGVGQSQVVAVSEILESGPIDDSYGLWSDYDARVNFAARPYRVLPDTDITIAADSYFDTTGASQPYAYADEWKRFCVMDRKPRDEWVTATQGEFKFQTGGPSGGGYANNKPSKAQIRQYLMNADVMITWFQVPLRYVRSAGSYFERFRGMINQDTWASPWYTWQPGELLYLNFSYREYNPVIVPVAAGPLFGGIALGEKLCDVTLMFLETRRYTADTYSPTNKNYVVGGHNLMPWHYDRKFHYGGVPRAGGGDYLPSFYSFPVKQLFTDPDFVPVFPLAAGPRRAAMPARLAGGRLPGRGG